MRFLACALLVACYRPGTADNCGISCASNLDRPSGTTCDHGACRDPAIPCSQGSDGPFCFGTLASISGCLPATPTASLVTITNTTTSLQSPCEPGVTGAAAAFCVVAFSFVHVEPGSSVGFLGAQPIVLVSAGTISIEGTVDVSNGRAGAQPQSCEVETPPLTNAGGGGGGGAGGSGADGGSDSTDANAGMGGPMPAPAVLSGGCRGQVAATTGGSDAAGGAGGGAIALITPEELILVGTILASGGGGGRGGSDAIIPGGGGGGGGGGGTIVIDGPLSGSGLVIAEGGGGGGGTTETVVLGMDGGTATQLGGGIGGVGGVDGQSGFAGGMGGNGGGLSGVMMGQGGVGGGGGGGGGGPGKIHFETTSPFTIVSSPPPT